MLGGQPCKLGRGLPAAAQDHEWYPLRHRHEHSCALAVGRAHERDGTRRQPGSLQRRPEDVVDEEGHGSQCRAAGAQDGCVQALEELTGDIEGDVRACLEVGADDADRDPALADLEPVRQRPGIDLALERIDRGDCVDLLRERFDTLVVQLQPVERPLVELPFSRPH